MSDVQTQITPGTLLQDAEGQVWISPKPDDMLHLDWDTPMNIFTGEVKHISKLPQPIKAIYGNAIQW